MSGRCPPIYFGGFSPAAKDTAAEHADVFLTWPDTVASVGDTIADMRLRARRFGRTLRYGLRSHVIVRDTEAEARAAARRLLSKLDADAGAAIRNKSLDTTSAGVGRQNELRESADDDGYAEDHLWTGIGRARSGAGAAIVGDPDQVAGQARCLPSRGRRRVHPVGLSPPRRVRPLRTDGVARPAPRALCGADHRRTHGAARAQK